MGGRTSSMSALLLSKINTYYTRDFTKVSYVIKINDSKVYLNHG